MSWLKEKYEKAALGGAAVIALGVGALILTSDAGDQTTATEPKRVNEYEVPASKALADYNETLATSLEGTYQPHKNADLTSFIAVPMYGIKGGSGGPTELDADTLFEGIPLAWWKENGLDDYQFSGAAGNDTDDDGFTHIEEYKAGTSPVDVAGHPDLLHKLKLVSSESVPYRIQGSYVDANRVNFTFRYKKTTDDFCAVGDTFPTKDQPEQFLNRFKFKAKGRAKNPSTNFEEDFYEVEDTQKAGKVHKLWSSNGPLKLKDWIGKFKLETPNGGDEFTVPEGGEFSLPYKKGGKGYKFLIEDNRDPKLKKLDNANIKKLGDKPLMPLDKGNTAPKENPNVIPLGLAEPENNNGNEIN